MAFKNTNLEDVLLKCNNIKKQLRDYSIDTSARIMFYIPPLAAWEKFVANMENKEVIKSRSLAVIVNLIIARPYGKFREYWAATCNTNDESSKTRKFLTETIGSIIFGLPTYAGVLYCSGASKEEIITALPFGVMLTAVTGRIFGRFLDYYRKRLGGNPILD